MCVCVCEHFWSAVIILISPLEASEVQNGREGNSCDHMAVAYCKAVYRVDSDPSDIGVAA